MSNIQAQKAGGVVTRTTDQGEVEVYVIHRPRYDDWTLPKGHIDEGESIEQAALREVFEETGLVCNIQSPLPLHTYDMPHGDGAYTEAAHAEVHFFHMTVVAKSNPLDSEADKGEWLSIPSAIERMTYESSKQYLLQIASHISR